MGKAAAGYQILSSSTFLKASFLHIKVLVSLLLVSCSLGIAFSAFLVTFLVLVSSTLFLVIFPKRKATELETEDKNAIEPLHTTQDSTACTKSKESQQGDTGHVQRRLSPVEGQDFPSEGNYSNDSIKSENLELCFEHSSSVEGSVPNEDESDDDDSLIEIALPGKSYCGSTEDTVSKLVPNIVQKSVFSQQLMELLAEYNEVIEEENLIEIDISIGSIKRPAIEA